MSALRLPVGENPLLSAYDVVVRREQAAPEDLAAEYARYFVSTAPLAQGRPLVFERFSLVDPAIRTVVRATTIIV